MPRALIISFICMLLLQSHDVRSADQAISSLSEAPLAAPRGMRAKAEIGGALLEWQPVKGADGYRIYWEREGNVNSNSPCLDSVVSDLHRYEVRDLTPGILYKFAVSALHSSEESPLSRQVGVFPTEEGKLHSKDSSH